MPLYEYRCKSCGHQFEKIQSFSAPEEKECPVCHGPLERLISAPAVQFKGSGWYVTDYASKGKSGKASGDGHKPAESAAADKPAAKPVSDSSTSSATPSPSSSGKSESTS